MSTELIQPEEDIFYPESDGLPMADNSEQLELMVVLYGNLEAEFADDPDVFVGANQNWYPVKGHPEIVMAPDGYVVFGRPKRKRPSYKQWEEADIPLTVVFEFRSPNDSEEKMAAKLQFYDDYGVEEYYMYDIDRQLLQIYLRRGSVLRRHYEVEDFVSPRLGIRFELADSGLVLFTRSGERFLTFAEIKKSRRQAEEKATKAEEKVALVVKKASLAEEKVAKMAGDLQQTAEKLTLAEKKVTEAEEKAAKAALLSGQRLARIAELVDKSLQQQASPEELDELRLLLRSPQSSC